jgi:hypothetical protein
MSRLCLYFVFHLQISFKIQNLKSKTQNLKSKIRLEKFCGRKPSPQTFRKIQNPKSKIQNPMQEDKRETSLELNNEKALQQLAWAIENSAGKFKLILARCNYGSLRSRLISRLKEICSVEISVLQLRESGRTLFAAILEGFGEDLPAALMVLGLDSVEGLPQMLANANQVREEFRKHFPLPLVLWINDDIYKQLMLFAPDFESWATSKNFAIQKDELGNHFRDIANLWFSNNLRLGEDDYLILKLELEAA